MANLFRRDEVVLTDQGEPISGVSIYVCGQPANTGSIPPSPLVQLYSDPAGATLLTKPPQTDSAGRASYYTLPGAYSIVYYSTQIAGLTVVLTDQIVASPTGAVNCVNDSSTAGTLKGVIDGSNTVYTLSATPALSTSLVLSVGGLVITGWTLSLSTVTLPYPPQPGNTIEARYYTA